MFASNAMLGVPGGASSQRFTHVSHDSKVPPKNDLEENPLSFWAIFN